MSRLLSGANLFKANMTGANFTTSEQLEKAKSLNDATMPDVFPDASTSGMCCTWWASVGLYTVQRSVALLLSHTCPLTVCTVTQSTWLVTLPLVLICLFTIRPSAFDEPSLNQQRL